MHQKNSWKLASKVYAPAWAFAEKKDDYCTARPSSPDWQIAILHPSGSETFSTTGVSAFLYHSYGWNPCVGWYGLKHYCWQGGSLIHQPKDHWAWKSHGYCMFICTSWWYKTETIRCISCSQARNKETEDFRHKCIVTTSFNAWMNEELTLNWV